MLIDALTAAADLFDALVRLTENLAGLAMIGGVVGALLYFLGASALDLITSRQARADAWADFRQRPIAATGMILFIAAVTWFFLAVLVGMAFDVAVWPFSD
jgi:uncharacterized membrane protein